MCEQPNYLRDGKLSREITKHGVKNDAALTSAGIRIRMLVDCGLLGTYPTPVGG